MGNVFNRKKSILKRLWEGYKQALRNDPKADEELVIT